MTRTGTVRKQSTKPGPSITVVIAFAANLLVATAKSLAAVVSGSASMFAEAAHSWADTGNQVFLLIADRRSKKGPTRDRPLGYGRESYVWSMFAAIGLFAAGAAASITQGVYALLNPAEGEDFLLAYIVLAVAFVFEGASFVQAFVRTRRQAREVSRDVVEHAMATSDPTLRAVFAEDAAALIGIVIAATGIGAGSS